MKPGELPKGYKRMNLNVETELHEKFKAAAALEGKNMTDVLIEFIRDYVRRHLPAGLRKEKNR